MNHVIQTNNNFIARIQSVYHQHAHMISGGRTTGQSQRRSVTFCSKSNQVWIKHLCSSSMSRIFVLYMHSCI